MSYSKNDFPISYRMILNQEHAIGGADRAKELYAKAGLDLKINRVGWMKTNRLQHKILQLEYERLSALGQLPGQTTSAGGDSKPPGRSAPVAQTTPPAPPSPVAPPALATARAGASPSSAPTLSQLNQIAESVFGREVRQDINRLDHTAMAKEVGRLAHIAHLTVPGLPAAQCARLDAAQIRGALLTERDARQKRVDAILAGRTPLGDYLRLNAADRQQFASDGGKLARDEFAGLSPSAKAEFCRNGGRLSDDEVPATTASSSPRQGNSVSRAAFDAMTTAQKHAHLRVENCTIKQ
jgi:hypothetical protein